MSFSQRTCGTELDLEQIRKNEPERFRHIMEIEKFISEHIPNENQRIIDPNGTIIIPVVVHILHDGSTVGSKFNPAMLTVQTQINVLNQDYNRLNADRTRTPDVFQGVAASMDIEFRLACIDPNGNPTTGVTRKNVGNREFTTTTNEVANGIKFNSTGGQDAWDTNKYLNIWVCKLSGISLGYTQSIDKYLTNPNTDGVVINTTNFGYDGIVQAPHERGRTATHEVGHWMGLRHIWGGDEKTCSDDDFVNDTPVQYYYNDVCRPSSSCGNEPNGDMFMNFMDYTPDACMNLFTEGQKARARANFMNVGVRASFANGNFNLSEVSSSRSCSSLTVSLRNQSCLPVT
ncbi:zinc metalloprotease [Bernardetia sp. MNP-M8]|uniref:zinc metalloprotease n=1 Tax=Bernardetia sp. MNP-M8 TaxID=3127470 RepID=UPI0030D126BB